MTTPFYYEANNVSNPSIVDPSDSSVIEVDSLKSVEDQLIEALEKTYTRDKLSTQTKFNAVCLVQFEEDRNTAFYQAGLFRVKARIPELHTMIPTPTDARDVASILLHPTFVGQRNLLLIDGTQQPLTPGTKIVVTFGNMNNFTEPQIISAGERA